MYLEYWGLSEKPFQNTTDPRFLCLSRQHEEALMRMHYAVESYHACSVLTGIFGSGKTLLAQSLLKSLPKERYDSAFIFNPQFSNVELLREILYQLGVHDRVPEQKTDILHRLSDILTDNYSENRHTVIVVDEAHLIEDRLIFEELRLLLNFQKQDRFLLTLILVGQPELREKISQMKQFDQRVSMRFHLKGLTAEETEEYICHRLEVAGTTKKIFSQETFEAIYSATGGLPRRINQVCDLALLNGFGMQKKQIDLEMIKEVTMDLQTSS